MKKAISIALGLLIVIGSISASIIGAFPFWYSFYVVGAFMLFGGLNYKQGKSSVYALILDHKWAVFVSVYMAAVIFGFLVDIIFGRTIADLWYYPHLGKLGGIFFPVLFYYPFGGFQIYELYYLLESILTQKIPSNSHRVINKKIKNDIANILIIFLIIGVVLPFLNFFINQNKFANELVTIFIILTIFSSDALFYKLSEKSILFDVFEGKIATIITMIITWFVATVLTEIPNTFSWEWIYHKVPFVSMEIFKINALVFTAGWFFLVFFPIRLIDIIMFYRRK